MRAAVIETPYSVSFQEQEVPKLTEHDILVKVEYCGICGTDVHIYKGHVPFVNYPIIPGHEFSGSIIKVGEQVSNLSVGEKVAINPNLSCKDYTSEKSKFCYYCKKNRPHFCKKWEALGVTRSGGFAEYAVCPGTSAVKIPSKDISLMEASFMEPIACALHGINKLDISSSDTILIIGAGPMGLIMISLLQELYSPKIVVSEPNKIRRDLASSLGVLHTINPKDRPIEQVIPNLTSNEGVDISIEAVGSPETALSALNVLNKGGRALIFGVASESTIPLSLFDLYSREWSIFGSFTNPHENQQAMDILAKKVIDPNLLVSHELDLANLEKGFNLMNNNASDAKKVLVKLAE